MKRTIPAIIIIALIIGISFLFIPEENYIVGVVLDKENMLIYETKDEHSGNLTYESGILCPTMGHSFQPGDRIYVDADTKTVSAPAELKGINDIQLIEAGDPLFGVGEYIVAEDGMVFPADERPCVYYSGLWTDTEGYRIGDVLRIYYSAILETAPSQLISIHTELIESRGFDPARQVIHSDGLTSQLHTMEVTVTQEHDGWYMVSHGGNEYTIPQWDEVFNVGDKLTVTYSIGTQELDGYNIFTRFRRAEKAH